MVQRSKFSPLLPELPGQEACLFCKIAQGLIPSAKVYETNNFLAFLDINPFRLGHTLVMPKQHYATVLDLPPSLGMELLEVIQQVGSALLAHTQAQGLNCMQNNYPAAGQVIFHAHWHLIPRHEGDGLFSGPMPREAYSAVSIEDYATMLRVLI